MKSIAPQKKVTRVLLKTTPSLDDSDKNDGKDSQYMDKASGTKKSDFASDEKEDKPDCIPGTEGCGFPKWFPR